MMRPRVLLAEMTREQIRAIAPQTTVILPTTSTEQHGPHLPIMTDNLACMTICQRAAEVANEQTPVTVAPPIHYGSSHHHFPKPGVLSLSSPTFIQVVKEILESLVRSGFPRIAIINGHGGNDDAVRVAATEVSLAHKVSIAAASYWTIAGPALMEETRALELGGVPGHAGAFETSLDLALRPDLVDQSAYPAALPYQPQDNNLRRRPTILPAGGNIGAGPGYTDDPTKGTAELGQRYLEIMTREVAKFLVEFART